jgi:chloramphenicol-sensitive protein RarD
VTSTPARAQDARSAAAQDSQHDRKVGTLAGAAAYSLWGLFPLVFHQLEEVQSTEILVHRILWSLVVVGVILVWRRDRAWFRTVRAKQGALLRLVGASVLIAVNWLVYIWAVTNDEVVQAALGYYVNPLITVALGVVVLGERLRRMQVVALSFGAASVAVLTWSYGNVPWVALVLACSFAGYGYLKKAADVEAVPSLAIETAVLAPAAAVWLVVLESNGDAAFLHGTGARDLLLVSLGIVTAVPLLLFGTAATRIPLSLLGLLQYLTPTLQLLCGVLILGEPLPPERFAGFVLVWIALIVLTWEGIASRRRETALAVSAEGASL